jgi:anti-anti-sigma factor
VYLPITTRQLADGTVEIAPSGEIDLDNAHVMRDAVNDVLTSSTPGKICLDLQRVMLIDSIGIGILVACFHTAAASGVKLVVSHPSPTWVCAPPRAARISFQRTGTPVAAASPWPAARRPEAASP